MGLFAPKEDEALTLTIGGELRVFDRPVLLGILNCTPDSFYDGGSFEAEDKSLAQAEKMLAEGADIVDVGGYSSRPGAADVSPAEEAARVLPIIEAIRSEFPKALISVDTFRKEVARQALAAGAHLVNDISGGTLDAEMIPFVGQQKVPYVLMHMRGTPQTMQSQTTYENLPAELFAFFQKQARQFLEAGGHDLILDIGLGFAKSREQNWFLLHQINYFKLLGFPVLVGLSRKSMIWQTLGTTAQKALNGTTAAHAIALMNGANLLRAHDVREARETIELVQTFKHAKGDSWVQDFIF